ncbi:inactive ubiquitin thioesterase OTULINL isoform X1 [Erinaceus europaeus]|uniref:Inactive ubiquitin thioesterase OTULINL isoform X1 n=1 Tax=Erinaceus europaeus TaxID=9365 RepID=A0ABM3XEI1_ERIEU|nr:inactive ubiquitin thioesterase OTULINL isoform X1 [Erinaceus europaeus]
MAARRSPPPAREPGRPAASTAACIWCLQRESPSGGADGASTLQIEYCHGEGHMADPQWRNFARILRSDASRGNDQVHSWTLMTSQALDTAWRLVKGVVALAMSLLASILCGFRGLHVQLGQQLRWWIGYLQRRFKRNLSVEAEVDVLSYCAREWRGDAPRAKLMRKAYEELFWRRHVKCVRLVRRDNYDALRSVLFQIFSHGLPFPAWMREKDIIKLPEKLLFSQGCNWIQQYSFGPEKYTGSNVFGKLRKCVELLKTQWTEFSGIKDHHKRGSRCNSLFSDTLLECKLYEALKFLMLYQVTEAYELMKTQKAVPSLFHLLFSQETSLDPLSFMLNHLNAVGDSCGLEQIDMFILGYSLEVKIKVFRLFKFHSRDFEICYPEEPLRDWPEVALLTENDRHYHIPVF